jgi:phosphoadenosine phosphosulfate reductase
VALVTETLFGMVDKVQIAIDRIRQFEPLDGYYGAFSGGKDSECIKRLTKLAGVKVDWHYNPTGIDPPEVVYHIRDNHPDVIFEKRKATMWDLIVERQMPPTRIVRYCCEVLKEGGGVGRFVITGVRWAESVKRKNNRGIVEVLNSRKDKKISLNNDNDESRRMLETCISKGKRILNPIVDWSDEEVWEFIRTQNIKYCSLYDEGFHRLGCIGCPMARRGGRLKEFARWPKFYDAYMRAFDRMVKANIERKGREAVIWKTAQDVMDWWLYEMPKEDPDQLKLIDEEVTP